MRVRESCVRLAVTAACVTLASAYAWTQSPLGPTGTYRGFTVTAVVKGKQEGYNLDGVTVRQRGNHLIKAELRFDRDPSTPTDWLAGTSGGIAQKDIELRTPDGKSYQALVGPLYASLGVVVYFDKTRTHGKAEFYAEVPAQTVCSTITLRLADSEFRFDQPKFPKACN
jgi:hypothetical protein